MNPSESRAKRSVRPFARLSVFALALALCMGTLACGGDETPSVPEVAPIAPAPAKAEAKTQNKASARATASMPTEEQAAAVAPVREGFEVKMGDETTIPKDFPSDVPLYPGAKPTASMAGDGEGTLVTFEIADGPEKVYDYYQQQFTDGGWQIAASASMGGQWMIRALKDGRAAHVSIAGEGSGSQVGVAVAKAQ